MGDMLEEINGWLARLEELRRVVLCEPDRVAQLEAAIEERGLSAMVEVQGSRYVEPGTVILMPKVRPDFGLPEGTVLFREPLPLPSSHDDALRRFGYPVF